MSNRKAYLVNCPEYAELFQADQFKVIAGGLYETSDTREGNLILLRSREYRQLLESSILIRGDLVIYKPERKVLKAGSRWIKFSKRQMAILHLLASVPWQYYSAEELIRRLNLYPTKPEALKGTVVEIMRKLTPRKKYIDHEYIITGWNLGYCFGFVADF